jgi:hypothetical protein
MPSDFKDPKVKELAREVMRFLKEHLGILGIVWPPAKKETPMEDDLNNKSSAELKKLFDEGKLEMLTPEQMKEHFAEMDRLIEQARARLREGGPKPN